ncbi:MAG TPA: hypothetical protein VF656_02710 [Pyrinomonadaceae bacterium]
MMLWILALPALAVIVMFAYVFGYRYGRKTADRAARLREEAWRERRYCGTALINMEEVLAANRIRQLERTDDDDA